MTIAALRPWLLPVAFTILTGPAQADLLPANGADSAANFAEISLLEDRVRVEIEIAFDDLPAFVSPPAPGMDPADGLSARVGKTLSVQADGSPLSVTTQSVDIRERKARVAPLRPTNRVRTEQPMGGNVVHAVLDYSFDGRPEAFTFAPPMLPSGLPAATLSFLVDHAGVPVIDYRYLSRAETLRPDWQDPWFSSFDNPKLTRHHKSALMSFVQIQPRQIRHEVIFRLKDLETWTDLDLGEARSLDPAAMETIKRRAAEVFSRENPLKADGTLLKPGDIRVEQISVGVDGLKVLDPPQATDRATALLGIVLSYPKPTLPEMVDVTWTLFTNSTQNVPIQMSDPAGGVPGQVTIDDPTLTWNNYLVTWENPATAPVRIGAGVLAVPHLSLLLLFGAGAAGFLGLRGHAKPVLLAVAASACTAAFLLRATTIGIPLAASTALDPELAEPVLERIVGNIGVAMLETTDPDYRAALSPFVVDEKTDSVGDEIRRGLSVTLPSGALAQIDSVENISVQEMSSEDGGNQVLASWQSLVSGGHWGHQHRRVIEYRALLDITADQGDWKLSGLTILGARTPDPAAGPGVSL